jgi:hypothetical protein
MVTTKLFTAEDLAAMGSDAPNALIDGELREVSLTSSGASLVAVRTESPLFQYVEEHLSESSSRPTEDFIFPLPRCGGRSRGCLSRLPPGAQRDPHESGEGCFEQGMTARLLCATLPGTILENAHRVAFGADCHV